MTHEIENKLNNWSNSEAVEKNCDDITFEFLVQSLSFKKMNKLKN